MALLKKSKKILCAEKYIIKKGWKKGYKKRNSFYIPAFFFILKFAIIVIYSNNFISLYRTVIIIPENIYYVINSLKYLLFTNNLILKYF